MRVPRSEASAHPSRRLLVLPTTDARRLIHTLLRLLQAGLCLYGHDLEEDISPIEAGLAWTVGKRRREKFDFLGGEVRSPLLAWYSLRNL